MLLSAAVCPGAGQLMQKRWMAGVVYLFLFLSTFGYLMTIALKNIVSYYRLGFEFDSHEPEDPVSTSRLLAAFGVALLIYLANVIDIATAHYRLQMKASSR